MKSSNSYNINLSFLRTWHTSRLSIFLRRIVTLSEHSGNSRANAFSLFSKATLRKEPTPKRLFLSVDCLLLVGLTGTWSVFICIWIRGRRLEETCLLINAVQMGISARRYIAAIQIIVRYISSLLFYCRWYVLVSGILSLTLVWCVVGISGFWSRSSELKAVYERSLLLQNCNADDIMNHYQVHYWNNPFLNNKCIRYRRLWIDARWSDVGGMMVTVELGTFNAYKIYFVPALGSLWSNSTSTIFFAAIQTSFLLRRQELIDNQIQRWFHITMQVSTIIAAPCKLLQDEASTSIHRF